MQIGFAVTGLAILLSVQAVGQGQPDFSGTWQMDASRSESARQAVPIGPVTLIVKQTPDEISIETRRRAKDNPTVSTETLTFKLDGSETSVVGSGGIEVKVKAHWDGPRLITETARNIENSAVTTLQIFSLDPNGKELLIDKTLTIQHGYQFPGAANVGKGKDVFVRARQAKK